MTDLSHFRFRDNEGDIWEHLPNNNFRLAFSNRCPLAVGMELSAADLREKYGPLTHITTEETPMSLLPGDQFRDSDGDIWRVMRDGKVRYLPEDDPDDAYETTRGSRDFDSARRWGLYPVPESERVPFCPPLSFAPVGAAYRDAEGSIWRRADDTDRWLTGTYVWEHWRGTALMGRTFADIDAEHGPLDRVRSEDKTVPAREDQDGSEDAPAESYRDSDGDTWYRLPNGEYTMRVPEEWDGTEWRVPLDTVRREYGPLTATGPAIAETSPSPREDAYKRARELVTQTRESGMTATAADVLHLAEFLSS